MKIPLNEFEQHIDEDILKRGLQYFKKGYVTSVDELSGGEYEATVEGSETYTVHMEVKNGVINGQYCTCPYDLGPVCKHEVAVMFYLQQEELGIEAKPGKKSKAKASVNLKSSLSPKKPKKKTIQEQLNEILDKLSTDELKGYIGECCNKDKAFRELFLAHYLHLIQPVSKDLYAHQIQAIVKSAAGRYGYLDYAAARKVGKAMVELSQVADKKMSEENYREAMYMGCAMLEEMTKAINHGDDSNGDLGGSIEAGQDILFQVAENCTDTAVRRELFDYALNAYQQQLFKGWDWHFHLLDLAIELIETEEDKSVIAELIDRIKPTGESWDFDYERARGMKLEFIRKTEGEAEVNRYLEDNTDNNNFRRELILKAIKEKNYTKAISLAEAGIVADQKDKPGLADEWKWHLLNVYQLQGDTANIILQARYLFLKSGRFRPQEMFEIMKKQVAPDEWKHFFEQLVADRIKSEKWVRFHSIADMYIWEEQWENLLKLLMANKSMENIEYVEKYLSDRYAEQLVGMYYNAIEEYLKDSVGRNFYKTACKYIRRMIKLGGRDEADHLIAELRKQYPQRRALMEELNLL
jgi:uncharacterized Zn finger protein